MQHRMFNKCLYFKKNVYLNFYNLKVHYGLILQLVTV